MRKKEGEELSNLDFLLLQLEETREVPDPIKNMPSLASQNRWIWDAFWTISASRPVAFDVGPIPLSEIWAYCELFEVMESEHRENLVVLVAALDRVFLEAVRAERPKTEK